MQYRCAVLDDYQNVALKTADWSALSNNVTVTVFNEHIERGERLVAALRDFDIICIMRERTPFPRELFAALPNLKLLITTGMRNASIDLAAAAERGVLVCGTRSLPFATAELAFGLILDLARHIGEESATLKAGGPWQRTIGTELNGKTLGLLGLGRLGSRMARYGQAFDMSVIAWSQNLTPERCREVGAEHVGKEELFRRADVLSIHVVLSPRSRGLVGAADLALMKPTALLVNTARGPIVEEAALIEALAGGRIAGAAMDVYDKEPLPLDHPFRTLPNTVLTPHLGYVTEENYRVLYPDVVEDIRAWLDGSPVRVMAPGR
jgi:phosphoglycerate dehydrogenase-like enzyme